MTRPGWVLMVGILMLMIGGCGGVVSDLKQIKTEELVGFAGELIEEMQVELGDEEIDPEELEALKKIAPDVDLTESDTILSPDQLKSVIKSATFMSEEAQQTFVKHGYMGLAISIAYGIIGILFFMWKDRRVVKLVIGILVASILFFIFQYISLSNLEMSNIFKIGQKFNLGLGAIFDLFILLVILISDKAYFYDKAVTEDHYDTTYTT